MGGWAIFYGAITLVAIALSLTARCPGTRRAAGFLAFAWLTYNVARPAMDVHDLAYLFAFVDTAGAIVGVSLFGRHGRRWSPYPDRWVHGYIACFVVQMVLHVWMGFREPERAFLYYLALNVCYFGQVTSVTIPSVAWWVRRWRRESVRASRASSCAYRFGRCSRCGPGGMVCAITGKRTARSA